MQRSSRLDQLIARQLPARAREVTEKAPQHIVSRAAAQRAARWARAIGEAGSHSLSQGELERLQQVVLQDARFVKMGVRKEGGFVGGQYRLTAKRR